VICKPEVGALGGMGDPLKPAYEGVVGEGTAGAEVGAVGDRGGLQTASEASRWHERRVETGLRGLGDSEDPPLWQWPMPTS